MVDWNRYKQLLVQYYTILAHPLTDADRLELHKLSMEMGQLIPGDINKGWTKDMHTAHQLQLEHYHRLIG
jgi:hypothetical protein